MTARTQWQGISNIARFNWPYYAIASVAALGSLVGLTLFGRSDLRVACGGLLAGSVWFIVGSLGVSHLIYDRSELYRWSWLERALRGRTIHQAILCHSGFDEVSPQVRTFLRNVQWTTLDHYDPQRMTEPSIRRARALFPATANTLPSRYDDWPIPSASIDLVLGVLAIHELRTETERRSWFAESKRCLRPGGRVVVVEHVRDLANFVAFGPGFLHFHSPASWRRCWEHAGLRFLDEFRVTPFVRVFVLCV